MKRIGSFVMVCLLCLNVMLAQSRPDWMDEDIRAMQFPSSKYLVGFSYGNFLTGENSARASERMKNAAQANLLESIKVNMKSSTTSFISTENANGQYSENEQFINQTAKSSIAEIVGMRTEAYYDQKTKTVYAFAYADRSQVVDYHRNLLQFNLSQVEGLLSTARSLSAQNDKASAREKCAEALSYFSKIDQSQSLLIAIGGSGDNDLQNERAKSLHNSLHELQSQLNPKFEIVANLSNELTQKIMLVESLLKTSKDLAGNGEKAKAKQQCEMARNMLTDVREVQESIKSTDPSVTVETLMQRTVEGLDNEIKLLSAQLAQAIMIYIESSEDMFGKPVSVMAGRLKSLMSTQGCSFTDDAANADYKLSLTAGTRVGSTNENFVFCYSDVSIDFFDNHKQKSVYSDDISEKGGSTTKEKAARKAMENAAAKILSSLEPWLK